MDNINNKIVKKLIGGTKSGKYIWKNSNQYSPDSNVKYYGFTTERLYVSISLCENTLGAIIIKSLSSINFKYGGISVIFPNNIDIDLCKELTNLLLDLGDVDSLEFKEFTDEYILENL